MARHPHKFVPVEDSNYLSFQILCGVPSSHFDYLLGQRLAGVEGMITAYPRKGEGFRVVKFGNPEKVRQEVEYYRALPPPLQELFPEPTPIPGRSAFTLPFLPRNVETLMLENQISPKDVVKVFFRIFDTFEANNEDTRQPPPDDWKDTQGIAKAEKAVTEWTQTHPQQCESCATQPSLEIDGENYVNGPEVFKRFRALMSLDQHDLLKPANLWPKR